MTEYARITAEIPWLASSILDGPGEPAADVFSRPRIESMVERGHEMFPMPETRNADRFQAQLWWYSMLGALVRPAAAGILVCGRAPQADMSLYDVSVQDNFWLSFRSAQFVDVPFEEDAVRAYGTALAEQLQPVLETLCDTYGIRPTPLQAVLVDEFAGAAVGAGNELMEPWRGVALGTWLAGGVAGGTGGGITPRFAAIEDDSVTPVDLTSTLEEDEPDRAGLVRSSCCMILESPVAEACTSCPKRSREDREAAWMG